MAQNYSLSSLQEMSIDGTGLNIAVVTSRFNDKITEPLLEGTLQTLQQCNVVLDQKSIIWVPGAFELPYMAKRLIFKGQKTQQPYNAIICLGCVIRGETSHYDYVCNETSRGIMQVALETGVPVIFGLLTTENYEQAEARAAMLAGKPIVNHKGVEAAYAAVTMARLAQTV